VRGREDMEGSGDPAGCACCSDKGDLWRLLYHFELLPGHLPYDSPGEDAGVQILVG